MIRKIMPPGKDIFGMLKIIAGSLKYNGPMEKECHILNHPLNPLTRNFPVQLEGNMLIVSSEKEHHAQQSENVRYTVCGFSYQSFLRTSTLHKGPGRIAIS